MTIIDPTNAGHIDPAAQLSPSSQAQATTTSNAATAANGASGDTKFNSMEDLRKKEPKLYETIVTGLGIAICQKMRRNQERSKKLMREYRNV